VSFSTSYFQKLLFLRLGKLPMLLLYLKRLGYDFSEIVECRSSSKLEIQPQNLALNDFEFQSSSWLKKLKSSIKFGFE
jgi:hypothetical protein